MLFGKMITELVGERGESLDLMVEEMDLGGVGGEGGGVTVLEGGESGLEGVGGLLREFPLELVSRSERKRDNNLHVAGNHFGSCIVISIVFIYINLELRNL